jgi:Na+-translocating ferredoxin:NAD+ oxidoreductase subunit B
MSDLYEKLRERLDSLSTGFPITKNGHEIKILKKLFTEQDAELFLQLSPMLETPAAVAGRLGRDEKDLAMQMEDMAKRGLIFRLRKQDSVKYGALPFVVGIMEFQVGRLDKELARELEDHYQAGFGRSIAATGTPLMRAVPINQDVAPGSTIAPFDDVMKIIGEQKTIMVAECICRKEGRLLDRGCDMPLEACFSFGSQADYYVQNGMGRYVTPDEAKAIVKKNLDEAPLVINMANTRKGGGFCMCCGDCCGILRSLKMQPKPAEAAKSNYRAVVNAAECTACEACVDRCQMDAISVTDGAAVINYDRCIGCGNCAAACPALALRLEKTQAEKLYTPPENFINTYMAIAKERGKL